MSTNSLAIFKQLFLKSSKDIKDMFSNISTFVENKDRAIADFLAVEYPELIWLIRVLHIEYDKQFSPDSLKQQQIIKTIARSITLTVDETGTLDYGQKDYNNLVFNTLETHLLKPQNNESNDQQECADIISLDGSIQDMDLVYQPSTTFDDIATSLHTQHPTVDNYIQDPHINSHRQSDKQVLAHTTDASPITELHNKPSDATVTHYPQHVTNKNASDVSDVAQIVDKIVILRGD